ncbi:MAG: hypothetical protein P4L33_19645 [Capsulimonadaceae bacterium]|nr:hypothetical protein [Capsulimonadaceae bacterium]
MKMPVEMSYQQPDTFRHMTDEERRRFQNVLDSQTPSKMAVSWYLLRPSILYGVLVLVSVACSVYFIATNHHDGGRLIAGIALASLALCASFSLLDSLSTLRTIQSIGQADRQPHPERVLRETKELLEDGYVLVHTYAVYQDDVRAIKEAGGGLSYLVALDQTHTLFVDGVVVQDVALFDPDYGEWEWPCSQFELTTTRKHGYALEIRCSGEQIVPLMGGRFDPGKHDEIRDRSVVTLGMSIDDCERVMTSG